MSPESVWDHQLRRLRAEQKQLQWEKKEQVRLEIYRERILRRVVLWGVGAALLVAGFILGIYLWRT